MCIRDRGRHALDVGCVVPYGGLWVFVRGEGDLK